jgi:hypothetical protein
MTPDTVHVRPSALGPAVLLGLCTWLCGALVAVAVFDPAAGILHATLAIAALLVFGGAATAWGWYLRGIALPEATLDDAYTDNAIALPETHVWTGGTQ